MLAHDDSKAGDRMNTGKSWNELCWYLIHTHPKQEYRAENNLKSYDIETFFPRFKAYRRNEFTGVHVDVVKPLFPNYLFVKVRMADLYHKIRYTRGVRHLVSFNNYPAVVDDAVIAVIKSRIGSQGLVKIGEDFEVGDSVIIKAGPLRSFTGVFECETKDSDRVMILLETVSYQARVIIDKALVQKVGIPLGHNHH
jgi:transcriptional antiterminator RfaH